MFKFSSPIKTNFSGLFITIQWQSLSSKEILSEAESYVILQLMIRLKENPSNLTLLPFFFIYNARSRHSFTL